MDKVHLGQGVVLEDGIGTSRPNDNQIIIGGTGTGKSLSVLWPTLCHMQESSFIGTFAKVNELNAAVEHFTNLGYRIKVWNLASPSPFNRLPDPMYYIKSDDDIQQIVKQIVAANIEYRRATHYDPYWQDGAEGLLTGIIYLIRGNSRDKLTMKRVLDVFYGLKIVEDGKGIKTSLDDTVVPESRDSLFISIFSFRYTSPKINSAYPENKSVSCSPEASLRTLE